LFEERPWEGRKAKGDGGEGKAQMPQNRGKEISTSPSLRIGAIIMIVIIQDDAPQGRQPWVISGGSEIRGGIMLRPKR